MKAENKLERLILKQKKERNPLVAPALFRKAGKHLNKKKQQKHEQGSFDAILEQD